MEKANGEWSKRCFEALIDKGETVEDVANALGLTRKYVSSVVRGRIKADKARQKIEQYLEMEGDNDGC